jgi:hypothetical protein
VLAQRAALAVLTERLISEFAGVHAAGTVIRHTAQAHGQLRAAGVRHGLATATEAMARCLLGRSASTDDALTA